MPKSPSMDSNAQVAAQKGAAVEDAGEATGLTRVSLAARLLGAIQLQAIREKVRRDREWATAFKGFRPGSVSQEVAVGRARHFALDMGLLRSLCDLAIDGLHIDEHHDFVTRLQHVAETTGKHPEIAAALGNLIDNRSVPCRWETSPRWLPWLEVFTLAQAIRATRRAMAAVRPKRRHLQARRRSLASR